MGKPKGGLVVSVNGKKRRYSSVHSARKNTDKRIAAFTKKTGTAPVVEIHIG